ncbi:MAG: hypothetical protein ACRDF0_01140, partial [Candidatus Limnocylindria bacterium]
ADGDPVYTIDTGSGVLRLDAGPPWFHGTPHPLAAFVGQVVTVSGERGGARPATVPAPAKVDEGPEIDVFSVTLNGNTTTIRAAGKPPWAGGPSVVGPKHPGYGKGPQTP